MFSAKQIGYAAAQVGIVGIASTIIGALDKVLVPGSVVGVILGGTLALHFALGAYAEAHKMKLWKVQLVQAGLIGISGLVMVITLIALPKLALADIALGTWFFPMASLYLYLSGRETQKKWPLMIYVDALPKVIYKFPFHDFLFAQLFKRPVPKGQGEFYPTLGECLREYILKAKPLVKSDHEENKKKAVSLLGLYLMIQESYSYGNTLRLGNRQGPAIFKPEDDPFHFNEPICQLLEIDKSLKQETRDLLTLKLAGDNVQEREKELKIKNPEQAQRFESLFKGIAQFQEKINSLPKPDDRQPHPWENALV